MLTNRPKTQLLVDGGDPEETLRIKNLIGFVDGQTTNPSLIAKNPEIQRRLKAGHQLSEQEEKDAYKKIVQSISPIVGNAGVSIEVFADLGRRAEGMLPQGQDMFTWIPNAYVKYPCTHEGLRAAGMSVQKSIRVNMTLCFSQAQAAAVYGATRGSKEPVYVSPFVGRLDDQGEDGMDLVRNIKKMYERGDNRQKTKETHHQPFALFLLSKCSAGNRAEQGFTGMGSSRLSYAGPGFQVQSGRREGQASETDPIQRIGFKLTVG